MSNNETYTPQMLTTAYNIFKMMQLIGLKNSWLWFWGSDKQFNEMMNDIMESNKGNKVITFHYSHYRSQAIFGKSQQREDDVAHLISEKGLKDKFLIFAREAREHFPGKTKIEQEEFALKHSLSAKERGKCIGNKERTCDNCKYLTIKPLYSGTKAYICSYHSGNCMLSEQSIPQVCKGCQFSSAGNDSFKIYCIYQNVDDYKFYKRVFLLIENPRLETCNNHFPKQDEEE